MSKLNFTMNGLIGKSGAFYPCNINEHTLTAITERSYDAPFAVIRTHFGDTHVEFEAYDSLAKIKPTKAQFETLMDWCGSAGLLFEDVTDCWNLPWKDWRDD